MFPLDRDSWPRPAVVAGTLALAVALSACGSAKKESGSPTTGPVAGGTGGGPTTTTALARPACQLLSREDVAAALGNPVQDPQEAGTTDCSWATAVDGGTTLGLTVSKPGPERAPRDCTVQKDSLPDGPPQEPVSGLGKSAVWLVEPLTTLRQGHLVACWDESVVTILLTGERDPAALRSTATKLAQEVHSRL